MINNENENENAELSKHWTEGWTAYTNTFGDDVKSHAAYRILMKIYTFQQYPSKKLSQSYLIKITGLSLNTVKKSMDELISLNYVICIREFSRKDQEGRIYKLTKKFKFGVVSNGNDVQCKPLSKIDSGALSKIDSGALSKIDSREVNIKKSKHKEKEGEDICHKNSNKIDCEKIKNLWNDIAQKNNKKLSSVRVLSNIHIKAVNKTSIDLMPTLKDWEAYFTSLYDYPFLIGLESSSWKATFAWSVKRENVIKVINGDYSSSKNNIQNISSKNYNSDEALQDFYNSNPFKKGISTDDRV